MVRHDEVAYLELVEVAELVRTRQLRSSELAEAILRRIDEVDGAVQCYAHVDHDLVMRTAKAADVEIERGGYRGPLHGVPFGVKDLCLTTDAPTGWGGTIDADFVADYDATVVTRLRGAGAVISGKLRMTEGAYTDHHPDLPVPVNPWNADTWTGVSSSGSGVALAAGLCFGAIGTDTGGSIRLPSSMNNVTGVKPTWGRVSRYGVVELAASLDHVGPMARSARDCAAILSVLAGPDRLDPTSSLEPVPDYLGALRLDRRPTVGVDRSLLGSFDEQTQHMLADVEAILIELGWSVVDIATPDLLSVANDFAPLCAVETAHAHAERYPARSEDYGPVLSDVIETGMRISAVDYQHLLERRRAFVGRLRRVFESIDLLLMPGVGFASPTLETLSTLGSNPDLLAGLLIPTAPFNLAGVPSATMPAALSERGTPMGFQLIGAEFREQLVLQAAHAFQQATDFHQQHPRMSTTSEGNAA